MKHSEAAKRYARALFDIATENKDVEPVLNQLREVNSALQKDETLRQFFSVPVVKAADQKKVLDALFSTKGLLGGKKFSEETQSLLLLLVSKRRLYLLPEIVLAFQSAVDAANGVDRGSVKSAGTLFADERKQLEAIISKHTGKKVVLEYLEDKNLLGGLIAQVGTFVFDDSLETQLRLLPQYLRRSH